MKELDSLSDKKLSKLIKKTEASLEEMRREKERRKCQLQDEEIEHLDDYITEIDTGVHSIADFLKFLIASFMDDEKRNGHEKD